MRLWIAGSIVTASLWCAGAGLATPGQDVVTASLRNQGFEVTLVHWTWLGRIRIIAVSDLIRREIVINPTTGEILRDYSQAVAEAAPAEDNGQSGPDRATTAAAPLSENVDASAMSALEEMGGGLAGPILVEPGQD